MKRSAPLQEIQRLMQQMLQYDSITGKLRWKVRPNYCTRVGFLAGRKHVNGHLEVGFNKNTYMAHHIAWFLHYGEWPDALILHANGDKGDNRIENLVQAAEKRR